MFEQNIWILMTQSHENPNVLFEHMQFIPKIHTSNTCFVQSHTIYSKTTIYQIPVIRTKHLDFHEIMS